MNKTMELDIWKGDWGLPSIDLKCLEILAFAKFSGVSFKVNKKNNPFWTPNGTFPVFKHGKHWFTDLNSISEYLRKKNHHPDFALNTKQTAEVVALSSMLREQLFPALNYIWWIDEKNYIGLSRKWYANTLPFPWNFYYPQSYRKNAILYFESLFPSVHNYDFIESEVYSSAEKCLTALSIRLGDSDFFFGSHPTSLDAIVFAYLAPLIKAPFVSNILQNHARACPNLVKYVKRICERYFLEDLKDFDESRKEKLKNDENLFKLKNNLMAGFAVVFLMSYYALAKGFLNVSNEDPFLQEVHHDEND